MNNKIKGNYGESVAAKYLKKHGYSILCTQYRCRAGEIDLVCLDKKKVIVFVEVKLRGSSAMGLPREAVTYHKQRTIVRCARYFIAENSITDFSSRFDVVEILDGEINHIVDAFRP
ncbi:MAG: YraN family protein [Corallococcus sp.]|nr:YraN family protein [Corallococcus sp.]